MEKRKTLHLKAAMVQWSHVRSEGLEIPKYTGLNPGWSEGRLGIHQG